MNTNMNTKTNIPNNSYLLIDLNTLRRNVHSILAELSQGQELIPVLKDDAYGLGLIPVTKTLCELPEIRMLAVAHVSEGLALRNAGIDREILVMGAALPFQFEAAVEAGLTLACPRLGFADGLSAAAKNIEKKAKIQIKIDTGLHRIGLEPDELDAFAAELMRCREELIVTGAFSHISDMAASTLDQTEYDIFLAALGKLEQAGISILQRHMACSAVLERYTQHEYNMDAVRIGRRLYMDNPDKPDGSIREVASLRSHITQIKQRKAGDSLGYGGAVTLERDSLIATVGIGYGDGLNQALFDIQAPVLVGGKRCRMLTTCMDQCLIDITGLSCEVGDEVTFFGYDRGGVFLSSQEIASLIGSDEGCGLTSALLPRVARIYVDE